VLVLGKRTEWRRSDSHSGRVGSLQVGILCFEVLELAEELVILTVRENRRIENVVLVRRAVKRVPQL
jgi:hypothetical protein